MTKQLTGAVLAAVLMLAHAAPAQTFQVLYNFQGGATDGGSAQGRPLLFGANLFGVAAAGGAFGQGTIFQFNIKSGALTLVYSFGATPTDGTLPVTGLVADQWGSLYGTTHNGGANNLGTIFQMAPLSVNQFHSFSGPDGSTPDGALIVDSSGNFYGTAFGGGKNGLGTVYKIDPSGNLTTLHSFNLNQDYNPVAGLLLLNGVLYGTTLDSTCATCGGQVFGTNAKTGKTSILYSFSGGADGQNSQTPLITDGQGNLIGTTLGGGTAAQGNIFKLNIATKQFTTIHSFQGGDGSRPIGALCMDPQGNIYGVATDGGAAGYGVVYKLDPSGNYTVLHSFTGTDGGYPEGGVVRDTAGNLFGWTNALGPGGSNNGTIYMITP